MSRKRLGSRDGVVGITCPSQGLLLRLGQSGCACLERLGCEAQRPDPGIFPFAGLELASTRPFGLLANAP